MEVNTSNPKLQEEEIINRALRVYKFAFDCPHCRREINETHFSEKEKTFQLIKERFRKVMGEEFNSHKSLYSQQWLKQMEENKTYEKFFEVVKRDETIEGLKKQLDEKKEELAKAKSYDEIRKLDGFKEMEKLVEKYRKENEELKIGNQPEIQKLNEVIKRLEEAVAKEKIETEKARSSEEVEKLDRVKKLKEEIDKYQKEIKQKNEKLAELDSSEHIEKLDRVRTLVEKNDKLSEQVQLLSHKQKMSKKQGEDLEKYVLEKLQETYNGSDEINKITHLNEKGDIIQEVYKDNQCLAKIIYEVKKGDKFKKKEWVDKLEKDMVNERAEYGVIVASCQNGQPLLKPFPQKNILVSDDENFVFASQVARMLIFSKQRLNQDENSKERIENLDGWVKEKLPNYLLKLENNLRNWEKDIMGITTIVKSMTKTREEIKRIAINEIALELREI